MNEFVVEFLFVWSPSVAFLCFFSMLPFPFIPCHPIDTESILLKASIPSKILFSFRGLNVCNSVCAWMGLWMWKCQCHFSFTSSPPFTRSTYPSIPYAKLCYYVLYLWWKSSMKTIFHNHVCFAWNCDAQAIGRGGGAWKSCSEVHRDKQNNLQICINRQN